MNTNDLEEAEFLGAEAFRNGDSRAPALHREFMAMAAYSDEAFPELAKAFLRGWDKANLDTPVYR